MNNNNVSLAFEKIYKCITTSVHPVQIGYCNTMIELFGLKYPKEIHLKLILHGFAIYRMRELQDNERKWFKTVKYSFASKVRPLNYN